MVDSPDVLHLAGRPPGATRINRKAGFAVIGLLTIAGLLIVYWVATRRPPGVVQGEKILRFAPAMQAASGVTEKVPDVLPPLAPIAPAPSSAPALPARTPATPLPATSARSKEEIATDDLEVSRRRSAEEARLSDTTLDFEVGGRGNRSAAGAAGALAGSVGGLAAPFANTGAALAGSLPGGGLAAPVTPAARAADQALIEESLKRAAGLGGASGQAADQNGQAAKDAFFAKAETQSDSPYLQHVRKEPLGRFILSAGSVIPCEMIGGLNSDLPGDMTAIVRQNVYDTATGDYLLIPQGAKIFGRYDSQVTYGQEGVNTVWPRMQFPDTSTLELDSMRGVNAEGLSGFRDQVDNHYWKIAGAAVLTSVFSAGVELSQLQQQNGTTATNGVSTTDQIGQTVGSSVGQSVAQLGADLSRKSLNIQPTINIRKGYKFNILVNKDILFPKEYKER